MREAVLANVGDVVSAQDVPVDIGLEVGEGQYSRRIVTCPTKFSQRGHLLDV